MSGFKPYEGPNEIVERLRAELAAMQKQRDEAREELEGLIAYRAVVALNKEGGGA